MDIQIKNYSFDKTAKTVTFTDYATIRLDSIRVITNVESNTIIYNFAQEGLGGSVLNNVLTLDYNTSSMVNTDKLQIIYNDDEIKATESGIQEILTELKLKADLTETQPISAVSLPLSTGASTETKQDNTIVQLTLAVSKLTDILANQTNATQKAILIDDTGEIPNVETRVQTPTGKALNVQIGPGDVISNIPVFIDFPHHQIHEGETYTYEYYSAAPSSIKFSFTVPVYNPTIAAPHLLIMADAYEGAAMVSLFESPTITGAGTAGTIYNRNRNIGMNAITTINSGVTTSNDGTRLPSTFFVGAGKESRANASGRSVNDMVMKSNTTYLIVVNEIVAMTRFILTLEWYEDLGV